MAAGNSICASSVFIFYVRNGRGYSSIQFAHNIGTYRTDVFLGGVIEALAGGYYADRYGGSWFDSPPTSTWD